MERVQDEDMNTTETTTRPTAEKVTQTRAVNKGSHVEYVTDAFWIAYPSFVSSYGHQSDRISAATGKGLTRKSAIAQALG